VKLNKKITLVCIAIFILGWFCSSSYSSYLNEQNLEELPGDIINSNTNTIKEKPDDMDYSPDLEILNAISPELDINKKRAVIDRPSPGDWIKEDQIKVLDNQVIIELKNAKWSKFTDTRSMDPIIDKTSNAIEIVPRNEEDINVGDIVSYRSNFAEGSFIHRVIEKETDKDGVYFVIKGDNNQKPDPGRIRFSQIERVLVAVIY
jgi:hypothetical protein